MQADRKRTRDQPSHIETAEPTTHKSSETSSQHPPKRKRHTRADDEIDALFNASFGKKVKKAALGYQVETPSLASKSGDGQSVPESHKDLGLERVLGAIRSAPTDDKLVKKKKHH
jgi:nucleolar protein 9